MIQQLRGILSSRLHKDRSQHVLLAAFFTEKRTEIQVKQNYLAPFTLVLMPTDPLPGLIYISDPTPVYHHQGPAHSPAHSLMGAPNVGPVPRLRRNHLSASGSSRPPGGPRFCPGDGHMSTLGLTKEGGPSDGPQQAPPNALERPRH